MTGPYNHPLRVYLIDGQKRIRNIYSYGLLDPRLVMTDIRTLLMEAPPHNPQLGGSAEEKSHHGGDSRP